MREITMHYGQLDSDLAMLSSIHGNGNQSSPDISISGSGTQDIEITNILLAQLSEIAGNHHSSSNNVEEIAVPVIIQISDVPDVRMLISAISDNPILQANFAFTELVVHLDSTRALERLREDEQLREIIVLADRVVAMRSSTFNAKQYSYFTSAIKCLNPTAEQVFPETASGELLEGESRLARDAKAAGTADCTPLAWVHSKTTLLELPVNLPWPRFALWLDALVRAHPKQITKIQGTIHTPNGTLAIRAYGGILSKIVPIQPLEDQDKPAKTTMVFCTNEIDTCLIGRSLDLLVQRPN